MKKILFLFVVILIFSCKSDNNVKNIDSKDYFGNFNKIDPISENSMISKDDWYKNICTIKMQIQLLSYKF